MANRFASTKLEKIDLGDGDFIEIKQDISYGDLEGIMGVGESGEFKASIKMMLIFIVKWNLKNEDGKDMKINEESIKLLDVETATKIGDIVGKKMSKKKFTQEKTS